MGVTRGAATVNCSLQFTCFHCGLCCATFVFYVVFCRSLFVLLSFFFWSLCCLSFDIRLLITPLVSSDYPFGIFWWPLWYLLMTPLVSSDDPFGIFWLLFWYLQTFLLTELFPRFVLHSVSEWVICILLPTLQFCSENKLIFNEMMMGSALY